jgi:hypothetical protein
MKRLNNTTMKKLIPLLFLGSLVGGCAETGADRIDNIQKLKILAMKAEHPDLLPGETTSVEVLVASPRTGSITTAIVPMAHDGVAGSTFAFSESGTTPAAPVMAATVMPENPQSVQFFYAAPQTPGTYDLAALVQEGMAEKFAPAGALKALKTVRVKEEGEALNENPEVEAVVMTKRWKIVKQGEKAPVDVDGLRLEPGEVARLEAAFTDETPDRASVVWWTTSGEIEDYGRHDMDFIAPERPAIVTVVALVLDRDNGSDWFIQDLAVGVEQLEPEVAGDRPLLVSSGGRFVWLDLKAEDRLALMKAGGKATVAIDVVPDAAPRLGWRAEGATLAVGKGILAGEVAAEKTAVLLAIDGIISRMD